MRSAPSTRRSHCSTADIGRMFPDVIRCDRTADPAHRAGAALPPVAPGARAGLQGGADRRRGRRGLCRLRHLQGSEAPPLLRATAGLSLPAAAAAAALPISAGPARPVAEISRGLLPSAIATKSAIRCSRICRGSATPPAQRCSFRAIWRGSSATMTRSTSCVRGLPAEFGRWHPLDQAQYLETAHLLPGYILSSQGDRVAMANAVEGRFPFLDHRVVEFAARIPPQLKMRGLREKHILREAHGRPAAAADRQPPQAALSRAGQRCRSSARTTRRLRRRALSAASIGNCRLSSIRGRSKSCGRNAATASTVGFRDNVAFVGILSTQLWHEFFVTRHLAPEPQRSLKTLLQGASMTAVNSKVREFIKDNLHVPR